MFSRDSIYPVQRDRFRTVISYQDVKRVKELAADPLFSMLVRRMTEGGEDYYALSDGMSHPDLNLFRPKGIGSMKDPFFPKLLLFLAWLNEGITEIGMIKLATYALQKWVKEVKIEGETHSVITNEEFVKAFRTHLEEAKTYTPAANRVTLFSYGTKLSRSERSACTLRVRFSSMRYHGDQLASQAVEVIARRRKLHKITHATIADASKLIEDGGMTEKASRLSETPSRKRRVSELNDTRPFKTVVSEQKYVKFLSLDTNDMTDVDVAAELGISKSTVGKYRKLKQEGITQGED